MTVQQLLREAGEKLKEAGVPDARFDAREILKRDFGWDTGRYLLMEREELEKAFPEEAEREEKLASFRGHIELRAQRVPLQQIYGECEFYGLPFYVNEHVLCPRQDTEVLVEKLINDYQNVDRTSIRVLDMCTGSGCIALSLAKCGDFSHITAVDISEEALKVAMRNAERLLGKDWRLKAMPEYSELLGEGGTNEFRLLRSDLFTVFEKPLDKQDIPGGKIPERFDIIVSNPPYIRSSVIEELEPEVREHEPMIALDGTEDGLLFYRRLTEESPKYLNPGGRLYVEIGYDQGEAVRELFLKAGFTEVTVLKDYGGNDRVVFGITK